MRARKIMEGMGGLNGFDFGPDDKLYGPLRFKGQVVRVDVDAGTMETVLDGLTTPAGVQFDSKGNLWVVDTAKGEVIRANPKTGESKVIATVKSTIDNIDMGHEDHLYLSNMADNGLYEIDTGAVRTIVEGKLGAPSDIALHVEGGEETLYVADTFSVRRDASGDKTVVVSGLALPEGIALAPDGTLLIAEVGKQRLIRVDVSSGDVSEVAAGLRVGLPAVEGMPPAFLPTGVAVSPTGTIYVSSDLDNTIYAITPPEGG